MVLHVVPNDPAWADAFAQEQTALLAALPPGCLTLHHIGSTSIPDILAKPIIDLLGATPDLAQIDALTETFATLGYEALGTYGIEGRRYFRKHNDTGLRTHHLHIFQATSPHLTRHIAFRDYLRAHPEIAAKYSALKAQLTAAPNLTWSSYLDGKDPFIRRVETDALAWAQQTQAR